MLCFGNNLCEKLLIFRATRVTFYFASAGDWAECGECLGANSEVEYGSNTLIFSRHQVETRSEHAMQ